MLDDPNLRELIDRQTPITQFTVHIFGGDQLSFVIKEYKRFLINDDYIFCLGLVVVLSV